jgi:hypothetical protein
VVHVYGPLDRFVSTAASGGGGLVGLLFGFCSMRDRSRLWRLSRAWRSASTIIGWQRFPAVIARMVMVEDILHMAAPTHIFIWPNDFVDTLEMRIVAYDEAVRVLHAQGVLQHGRATSIAAQGALPMPVGTTFNLQASSLMRPSLGNGTLWWRANVERWPAEARSSIRGSLGPDPCIVLRSVCFHVWDEIPLQKPPVLIPTAFIPPRE